MQYRQLLRLATLSAVVFFIHATPLHAQRARNTVLFSAESSASGEVSGTVTAGGSPLAGARVVITNNGKAITDAITGADGTFKFRELIPDHYDLSFSKTGYRKRIIKQVPVVEEHHTYSDLALAKVDDWQDERSPKIQYYETLKDHKIEKMK